MKEVFSRKRGTSMIKYIHKKILYIEYCEESVVFRLY